jgi:hypothetical protein
LQNQKKLLEEHNRRLQTGISDTKRNLADAENILVKLNDEYENIRQNNQYREQENEQLQEDLQSLDYHLNLLEK